MKKVAFVLLIFLCLGFWKITSLPGEWYGDISILHEEVLAIIQHPLSWNFNLSAGPVYHHWVALWAVVLGTNYLTYKIVSIVTGAIGLVGIYLLGKEWFDERVGWWAMVWAASSFWLLVWSRLGSSPQIATGVIVAYSGWFLVRYLKHGCARDWLAGVGIAALSWWTYPSLFVWPAAVLIGIPKLWHSKKMWLLVVPVSLLGAFILTLHSSAGNTLLGYAADKVQMNQNFWEIAVVSVEKLIRLLNSWHLVGDSTFRTNVPLRPHLDLLAGILLLIGMGYMLSVERFRRQFAWLWLGILLLLMPSLSPGIPLDQVINSSRLFATLPLVMLLVGIGSAILEKRLSSKIVYLLVAMSLGLTLHTYFGPYQKNLPNFNSPYSQIIAHYITAKGAGAEVKLTDCCWGEWGQPEPKGIYYSLAQPQQSGRIGIVTDFPFISDCDQLLPQKKYLLLFNPKKPELIASFKACFTGEWTEYVDQFQQKVFVGVVGIKKSL